MATYLITGGAGFIGSNLAHTLVGQGDDVRVLDNLSSGRMENLEGILDKIQFVEGDIRDMDQLRSLAEGVDYILHQAAVPSVVRSVEDPLTSNDTNINGTLNVFLAARDMGVKRVVAASSSSVTTGASAREASTFLPSATAAWARRNTRDSSRGGSIFVPQS